MIFWMDDTKWVPRIPLPNEVVLVLYKAFGIIWYYTVLYSSVRDDSNYTNS